MNLFATAMSLSMMAAVVPDEAARPIRVSKAGGAPSAVGSAIVATVGFGLFKLFFARRLLGTA